MSTDEPKTARSVTLQAFLVSVKFIKRKQGSAIPDGLAILNLSDDADGHPIHIYIPNEFALEVGRHLATSEREESDERVRLTIEIPVDDGIQDG